MLQATRRFMASGLWASHTALYRGPLCQLHLDVEVIQGSVIDGDEEEDGVCTSACPVAKDRKRSAEDPTRLFNMSSARLFITTVPKPAQHMGLLSYSTVAIVCMTLRRKLP